MFPVTRCAGDSGCRSMLGFFLTGVISVRPLNAWSHTIDCAICEGLKTLCQKAMRLLRPITLREFDNLCLWGH